MRAFSDAYLRRLAAPIGVGDLVPADAGGEAGSVVGGSGVRVTLCYDRREPTRVAAIAFRALGSAAPHAPGSVLVERVVGATREWSSRLRGADLLAPLGDVPAPVVRAADALAGALAVALAGGSGAEQTGAPGVLVCRCFGIGDRTVRRAIRGGARRIEEITATCSAGGGCHSCWPDLRAILDEEGVRAQAPPPPGPLSLADVVARLVRPLWRAQGVALGDVHVDGHPEGRGEARVVRLGVAGIARDALASPIGAVAIAAHLLREVLGDEIRVEPLPAEAGTTIRR